MGQEFSVVGKRLPDVRGFEKVTGSAEFVSDICLPGMLIGKVLHSPYAHAKIVSIDTSEAEGLPGVESVITAEDVPKKKYTPTLSILQGYSGTESWGVYDRSVLNEKVRYVGDPVAAVAAVNERVAKEALELIEVEYEVLPAVYDESEAVKEGAPEIHDIVLRQQADETMGEEAVDRNLAVHVALPPLGDVEKGFLEADYIIEETAYTTPQKHATLEPYHCIASFAAGKLTLRSPIQQPFPMNRMLAHIFDIPVGNIRNICEYIGGEFGSGVALFTEPLCVALSMKSGKPVKLIYSREEDFACRTTRACLGPYTLKMGVKEDGTITALERKIIAAAGGYTDSSALSALIAATLNIPLYRCPSRKVEIDAVYTNKLPTGAMRGFGNPEDTFIREQVMDVAAEKIGMDPIEFRLKTMCQVGDPNWYSPDSHISSAALDECITIGAEKIGWKEKRARKKEGIIRKGIGISCMAHCTGAWPVHAEHSNAWIKINEDASIVLSVSPPPIGMNAFTSLAQVAAEVLGLPFEDVHVVYGDTDVGPWEVGSHASRTMYLVGNAVYGAATEARGKLLNLASKRLGVTANELDIKNRRVYVKATPEKDISVAELTKRAIYSIEDVAQITGSCSYGPNNNPPAYQALFTEVEVDTETGSVKVLKMVVANDSGISINPMTVEGQLQGGTVQGLGYALFENPVINTDSGIMETDNFNTYKIPRTQDIPDIELVVVEQPESTGPFGAKGVGEPGTVNQAPSIANAIYDAVGIRIWELPITPEKVLKAVEEKKGQQSE